MKTIVLQTIPIPLLTHFTVPFQLTEFAGQKGADLVRTAAQGGFGSGVVVRDSGQNGLSRCSSPSAHDLTRISLP